MRGGGDHFSVGERVAFYRRRRGFTQRVLADLVGRSEDWLSKIERGERDLRRIDVIAELARALRVSVGDLLGQPVLVEDDQPDQDDIPAIRSALMNYRRLSAVLFGRQASRPLQIETVERVLVSARGDYESGRLGRTIAALPNLINHAQQLEDLPGASTTAYSVSARIHHLAASTLTKVGESDLAWMAAERAMAAADQSENPLVIAAVARSATGALLAIGRFDDALQVGTHAARWLEDQIGSTGQHDPVALSLCGMLYLRSAEAAARIQDRHTAAEMLQHADTTAVRLAADANFWHTNFNMANVGLHRVAVGLDLDDIPTVLSFGPQIDTSVVSAERSASYRIDMARAFAAVAQDDDALGYLLDAQQDAAQLVWHSAAARETVRGLYRRAHGVGQNSELATLAERCRAIA